MLYKLCFHFITDYYTSLVTNKRDSPIILRKLILILIIKYRIYIKLYVWWKKNNLKIRYFKEMYRFNSYKFIKIYLSKEKYKFLFRA